MRDNEWCYEGDRSFDVVSEMAEMSRLSALRRRHRFRRSAVDRYRGELAALYAAGLSFAQLALWLQRRKKVKISRSALHRRMRQWHEVPIRRRGQHGEL